MEGYKAPRLRLTVYIPQSIEAEIEAHDMGMERMGIRILHLNIKRLLLGSFINQFVKKNPKYFPSAIQANFACQGVRGCHFI
jgi:hypothetical protein